MISSTCPVCGGKLNIRIGADFAECGSCGNVTECDRTEMEKIRSVYRSAELAMKMNSVSGCRTAIKALEAISFVEEADELSKECSRRLDALLTHQAEVQGSEQKSGKKNAALGVALIVFILLCIAALLFGGVYLVIRLVNGTLPDSALPIVIAVAAVALIIFLIGKFR